VPVETAAKDRLAFLDIARGLAALLVVVSHGLPSWWPGYWTWSVGRVNLGSIGVLLFFVISGFMIPTSLCQGGSQARFWWRRIFRLFPLYWTVIALCWLSTLAGGPTCNVTLDKPQVWLVNLTMLQGFVSKPHVLGIFWTLHWELMIYGVCSLLFALGLLQRRIIVVWMVILALYIAYGAFWCPLVAGQPFLVGGQMFYIMAPFFGAAFENYVSGRLSRTGLLRLLICFYLGIAFILAVNWLVYPECHSELRGFWMLFGHWFFAYTGFALLVASRSWLHSAFLAWTGRVSFSVYLGHAIVVGLLMLLGCPPLLFLPALIGGTLGLSALGFKFVETPGILLGRALEAKWLGHRRSPLFSLKGWNNKAQGNAGNALGKKRLATLP
jgi:peptidoglycan/LPS O-acetylase OafA/YrhL